jgi:D-alanine-D-alanine ligase
VQTLLLGREFTVSLIGNSHPEVLAIAEACNKESLHTFEEKYNGPPEYEVTPAQIPKELEQYLNEKSKEIYVFLGCRGVARIDWRCNAE